MDILLKLFNMLEETTTHSLIIEDEYMPVLLTWVAHSYTYDLSDIEEV